MLFLSTAGPSTNVWYFTDLQFLTEGKKKHPVPALVVLMKISTVACSTCTCDDVRVYAKGIVGWVDASLLVVLLAEGECASIHANVVDVCIASHCGLW